MASAMPVVPPVSATAAGHLGIATVTPAERAPTPTSTTSSTAPVTTTADLTSPSTIPQQPPDVSDELAVDHHPRPSPGGLDSSPPQGDSAPAHQVGVEDETLAVTEKRAPGRQSWAKGTKLKYLESLEDDWRVASDGGLDKARKFYDRCTNGFLHKFGYDRPPEEDDPSPNPDPTPEQFAAPPPAPPGMTEEQAAERSLYARTLRLKLQRWFLHRGRYVRRSPIQAQVQALWNSITKQKLKAPKRQTSLNHYIKMYWDSEISQVSNADWKKTRDKLVKKSLDDNLPLPEKKQLEGFKLKQTRTTAQRLLNAHSDEFRDELKASIELDYQHQKAEYEALSKPPSTAEDFDEVIQNCALHIQAIADGISERLGLATSILMTGPIPALGGKLAVRSVHSGVSMGPTGKTWPEWDSVGYRQVENNMLAFSRSVYSDAECKRRALPSNTQSPATDEALRTPGSPTNPALPAISPTSNSRDTSPVIELPPMPPTFLRHTKSSTLALANTGTALEEPSPAAANGAVTSAASTTDQQPSDGSHSATDQHLGEAAVQPSGVDSLSPPKPNDVTASQLQSPPSGGMDPLAPLSPDIPQHQPLPKARPRPRYVPPIATEPQEMLTPSLPVPPSQALAPTHTANQAHDRRIPGPVPAHQDGAGEDPFLSLDLSDFPNHCRSEYAVIVEKVDWGTPWYECVRAAIDMQRSAGYPEAPRSKSLLPTRGRPEAYSVWNKYGRRTPPAIDLETFPAQFKAWWRSLQPPERGSDASHRPTFLPGDVWGTVQVATRSGFCLLLIGLSWWRKAIIAAGAPSHSLSDWEEIVEDVAWVVKAWGPAVKTLGSAPATSKRKRAISEANVDVEPNEPRRSTRKRR